MITPLRAMTSSAQRSSAANCSVPSPSPGNQNQHRPTQTAPVPPLNPNAPAFSPSCLHPGVPYFNKGNLSKKCINICHLNARSLKNKLIDVKLISLEYDVDIIAVSETWFNSLTTPADSSLVGFQAPFRRDRADTKRGGGVCIYVKEDIACIRRLDLEPMNVEIVVIEVFIPSIPGVQEKSSLIIACCYRPPSAGLDKVFLEQFERLALLTVRYKAIFIGDFNAKNASWWPGDTTSMNGHELKCLADDFNLAQLCELPTYVGHSRKPDSLLDLAFSSDSNMVMSVDTLQPVIDHLPILLKTNVLGRPAETNKYLPKSNNRHAEQKEEQWDFRNANLEALHHTLMNVNWEDVFDQEEDMNGLWEKWKAAFLASMDKSIPKRKPCSNRQRTNPWFNSYLSGMIRRRNRLFRCACRSDSEDLWVRYKEFRNKVTAAIRNSKRRYFMHKATLLMKPDCPSTKWWKVAKELTGQNVDGKGVPPLQDMEGSFVYDDKGKAALLNGAFINQCATVSEPMPPFGPTSTSTTFNFQPVYSSDITKIIQCLPNKHSSGPDGISYIMLKLSSPIIVGPLVRLFNISLQLGEVPEEWKDAVVIPLHKGGRKPSKDPLSYRPISLTSCVARVLEKALNLQIREYLAGNNLIYDQQSGFLPHHSTVTQLCYLTHKWTMALDQRQFTQAAFLDLSKAYNRVPTAGLLFKLSGCGFSTHSLKWMESFLANRRQRVRVGNMDSEWATLPCGIPQGTVLGPTLFLVFINDLPTNLVGKPSIFADDSTVYSHGNDRLETCRALSKDLDSAQDWAVTWGMLFNADKSEWLQIASKDTTEQNDGAVAMKGRPIPRFKAHNHLGLKVTSTLSWSEHINGTRAKCAQRVGMIRKIRHLLPKHIVRKIYLAQVRSVMEYGGAVWSGDNISVLQKLQDRFCRENSIKLPPVQARLDYLTLLLLYKIKSKLTPLYLQSLLPETCGTSSRYHLRGQKFPVPAVRTSQALRSFLPRSIVLWNDLPPHIQALTTVSTFKSALKKHFKL